MLWYAGWLESIVEQFLQQEEWEPGATSTQPIVPEPPSVCWPWLVGKVREGEHRVTWWRGLRAMERLTLSSDLQRDTGNFLHKCRGKAMIWAISLSPQQQSNHTAHRCSQRLHSSPLHASGHIGRPGTLQERVTISLGNNHGKNRRPHVVT